MCAVIGVMGRLLGCEKPALPFFIEIIIITVRYCDINRSIWVRTIKRVR